MKKIPYTLFINDDTLFFLNNKKNKIYSQKMSCLKEEEITNSEEFSKEFAKFLIKNHIRTSLFGKNIYFLKSEYLNPIMQEKYLSILNDYFKKIALKDLTTILKITNQTSYLNINDNYIDYYYLKKNTITCLRIPLYIFNNNILKTINHFFTNFYKPKKLILFGNKENIASIAKNIFKNYNIPTTFSEFPENYILEEFKEK